ncbi:MAG: DNA polymerase IV [Brockia lithotrophica]|nr:DNA polymerase IV [Brockia lithotrophica]
MGGGTGEARAGAEGTPVKGAAETRERVVLLVDMESFFASVEVAARPDLRGHPVVVAGDPERRHGVVLAATREAKACGVSTAMTLGEALLLCPEAVVVRPHMARYLATSLQITGLLEAFSDLVEPYSIDEQFVELTPTLHLFGTAEAAAQEIRRRIREVTGINARVGIGPNKLAAKMACDVYAKKISEGVFRVSPGEFAEAFWHRPVEDLFGVARRLGAHLRGMGIRTIGQLAQTPEELLRRRFGKLGARLHRYANGIDPSPVDPSLIWRQKGVGRGITLPRDYREGRDVEIVILELADEVAHRARALGVLGKVVGVGIGGAYGLEGRHGFFRQTHLSAPTRSPAEIAAAARALFRRHWSGFPVRHVSVFLGGLSDDGVFPLELFRDRLREEKMYRTVDYIWARFGRASLVRASSLTSAGQARERARKIGGHEA